ncbi:MAG: hypothetical protein Q7T74_04025 [Candidatus Saccharibacteria bacterium]|nr:hypothetical protein [Candidatus Saccharibacteria bacterium]
MNEDEKPVAYDTQGRPLYYRAEPKVETNNIQNVHVVKDNPTTIHISEEIAQKHIASKKQYPSLNLSEGEYVITSVKRHPLGLITIWLSAIGVSIVILIMPMVFQSSGLVVASQAKLFGSLILIALLVFVVLIAAVATMVYQYNKFYITNESVIQHIQTTLFSQNDQIVSLGNIEDASYRQVGLLQTIFGYGAIRLSTQGDETTYKFTWVSSPKKQVDLLNNTVEAFKNGRPIES